MGFIVNLQKANSIKGWMNWNELIWIANQAKECTGIILEVGSLRGRSTVAWAENAPIALIYAIDPWTGTYYQDNGRPLFNLTDDIFNDFLNNVRDINNIIPFVGDLEGFQRYHKNLKADIIFLDGDHRYDAVKKDIALAKQLIKPGGTIAGHDYTHTDWPGVKKAVDEEFPNIQTWESIWWTRF